MKKLLIYFLLTIFASTLTFGQVNVRGYTKKDGTVVAPYTRSSPGTKNIAFTPSSPVPSGTAIPAASATSSTATAPSLRVHSFKVDQTTTDLVLALIKDGWVYIMPMPKSPQAVWGNKDGRTTWFIGYWKNDAKKTVSTIQPTKDKDGKLSGNGVSGLGVWHNGGAPVSPTKTEWLYSKSGGIEPSS